MYSLETLSKPTWPRWLEQAQAEAWKKAQLQVTAQRGWPRTVYRPRGTALALQSDRTSEILVSGPAGTGKSRACLEKIHRLMQAYPSARALIVRQTRESMNESILDTFERYVLGLGHPLIGDATRPSRHAYRYPNGSEVIVGGMKQASRDVSEKIMSSQYDLVYVCQAEELPLDKWEQLTTRLRNNALPFQQIIACANPSTPTHWLKRRCDAGVSELLESRHEDNPRLWDGADWTPEGARYIAVLDKLTGPRRERLRFGRWVQAEGVVYEGWDAAVHLIDPLPIPAEWRRIRSIDFGYANPFVCQWWAMDGDGRAYLYRQIYMTGRIVEDHARQIKALSADERIETTVADHDAEDRATLERHGISTIPARKEIRPGLDAVAARLRKAGDGQLRLFVMRDSLVEADPRLVEVKKPLTTEQEFDSYMWPKAADGRAMKEIPVDDNNHGMDALRYAVMYLDAGLPTGAALIGFIPMEKRYAEPE